MFDTLVIKTDKAGHVVKVRDSLRLHLSCAVNVLDRPLRCRILTVDGGSLWILPCSFRGADRNSRRTRSRTRTAQLSAVAAPRTARRCPMLLTPRKR